MNPIEYLFGLEFHGHKFGLDNIRAITDALGRPQFSCPVLHVAGTNGKGSVCAMAEAALRRAGHRTACFTSPHLVDLEERFRVDGRPLPRERVAAAVACVHDTTETLLQTGRLPAQPTFFEVATAAAFVLFRDAGAQVAVIEVGLGGRLDATNVTLPAVGAITNIAFDHQQYLGDTLGAIAAEKAGIIKSGMRLVSGERGEEARAVIRDACAARSATLIEAHDDTTVEAAVEAGRTRVRIVTPRGAYGPCWLALRGRHQIDNAVVAVRSLEALDAAGMAVPSEAIVAGLRDAVWPGRLETIAWPGGGDVLLDAAHNPAGARILAAYLAEVHPDGVALVVGAVRDKDHRAMLDVLVPHARTVIVTEPPTPRAAAVADLEAEARAAVGAYAAAGGRPSDVRVEIDPADAIDSAMATGHPVCVAGSIFLVGAVLGRARGLPARGNLP